MKPKLLFIFGTRPEAIKMAPLIKTINQTNNFKTLICVTAQHREMLDSVLEIFDIKPDYDLNLMQANQSLLELSNEILKNVSLVIEDCNPNLVLVHGDTTTTLNSALAAFYKKVPIAHIEAGLRSNNKYSPFPEEINRRLVSALADLHFAPTLDNKNNLISEGIDESKIHVTGNTVIDALLSVIKEDYKFKNPVLNSINYTNETVILLTTHRRENIGVNMENIFRAMIRIILNNSNVKIIFPMHKNPKVRRLANRFFKNYPQNILLIEPLDYVDFANLMSKSSIILTDSGGIQEEAPSLGKPVLVLRNETERVEAIKSNSIQLVGVNELTIYDTVQEILNQSNYKLKYKNIINPYGIGDASTNIIPIIYDYFEIPYTKKI